MKVTLMHFIYRNLSPVILCLPLIALLAAPTPSFAAKRKIKVKLGTLAPSGSKWLESIERMGRRWKEVSKGQINLKVYGSGVAGDESDMVRKMRIGQLQAATITNIGLGSIDRSTLALQIPMMFDSYEELDYVRERIGPKLESSLEKKGFIVLDWGDAGWVYFFSKEKAVTPDAMRKQKLFVWSGDPQAEAAWRAAGFDVVPTATSDVLQGLQTGRLEAFAMVPMYALASQWFGLAQHMTKVRWAPLTGATVITKAAWDKVDPELKVQLKQIAVEESDANRTSVRSLGGQAIKAMTDRGLNVYEPDAKTLQLWKETAVSAYANIKENVVPVAYFDEVQKLIADFRAGNK